MIKQGGRSSGKTEAMIQYVVDEIIEYAKDDNICKGLDIEPINAKDAEKDIVDLFKSIQVNELLSSRYV